MEGADVKKMQIVLDEEKIRREGAYDPDLCKPPWTIFWWVATPW